MLTRLKHAKVQAMLLALLSLGITLSAIDEFIDSPTSAVREENGAVPTSSPALPARTISTRLWLGVSRSVADACLVAFLLGATYEWKIRAESEEHLEAMLKSEMLSHSKGISKQIAAMAGSLRGSSLRSADTLFGSALHSELEFFDRLEASVITAKRRIDLTYFDNCPPVKSRTPRGLAYFKRLADTIVSKPDVSFRRIVRTNEAMWPWLEELIGSETGHPNSSVACLVDLTPERACGDAVTVQLIDNEDTFLVSVGTQTNALGPRDVFVKSEMFAGVWSRYYNQLWSNSRVIIDRGVFREKEWEAVKALTLSRRSTGEPRSELARKKRLPSTH